MQVEAGDEEAALKTIHSLPLQAVSRWKLVPVFKGGAQRFEVPDQINQQDQISSAIQVEKVTPSWLSEMETDFLVFCRAGDIFSQSMPGEFSTALTASPGADVIYSDSEFLQDGSSVPAPFFKPAVVSPELMVSTNYLSRSFIRRSALADLSVMLNPTPDLMILEYEWLLQLANKKVVHYHIPRVLVTLRQREMYCAESVKDALTAHFEGLGMERVVVECSDAQTRVNWDFGNPAFR